MAELWRARGNSLSPIAPRCHAAIPTWHDAVYPLDGSPTGVTSSNGRLSAKIPSDRFDVGFDLSKVALSETWVVDRPGNVICVTSTDWLLIFTLMECAWRVLASRDNRRMHPPAGIGCLDAAEYARVVCDPHPEAARHIAMPDFDIRIGHGRWPCSRPYQLVQRRSSLRDVAGTCSRPRRPGGLFRRDGARPVRAATLRRGARRGVAS